MSFQFKPLSTAFYNDSAGAASSIDNAKFVYIAAPTSDTEITNADTGFKFSVPTGNIVVMEKGKYEKIWATTVRTLMTKITQPR